MNPGKYKDQLAPPNPTVDSGHTAGCSEVALGPNPKGWTKFQITAPIYGRHAVTLFLWYVFGLVAALTAVHGIILPVFMWIKNAEPK